MKIFDRVLDLINEKNLSAKELQFGNHSIIRKLGAGEQGLVLQIKNKIGKSYALKFYSPISKSLNETKLSSGLQSFTSEIDITKSLNHKNIVKIITGGVARWNSSNPEWDIQEGFESITSSNTIESLKNGELVLFYIMDFIDGYGLEEIFTELSVNAINEILKNSDIDKNDEDVSKAVNKLREAHSAALNFENENGLSKLKIYESLISQCSEAIQYFNSEQVYHTDIKADNIRYSKADRNFVIVDFGFARDIFHDQTEEEVELAKAHFRHYKVYDDTESHKKSSKEKNLKVDQFQFASLLKDILPEFKGSYHMDKHNGLVSCFSKATGSWDNRYENLSQFYSSVRLNFVRKSNWRLNVSNGEYLTPSGFGRFRDSPILIPPYRQVYVTTEIQNIVDSVDFQRLKEISQLGPTKEIFPGARHTRFEHSLGVYWLSLRYLERLLKNHHFRMECEPIDQTIKLVVLAALLHDLGHYPYSHWIEEMGYEGDATKPLRKIARHEDRAIEFITNGQIGNLIRSEWQSKGEDIITPLVKILQNDVNRGADKRLKIINSIINSQIDADKMDYLIRDSIHTGTFYGLSIDVERFLISLCLNESKDHIGLTTKGKQVFNSFLTARNNMYEGVYWHKTVRSTEAMIKRAFFIYLEETTDSSEKVKELFDNSDDRFMNHLHGWFFKNRRADIDLIRTFVRDGKRLIYKPIYTYHENISSENADSAKFFDSLFVQNMSRLVDKCDVLISRLNKSFAQFDAKPLTSTSILLETTPLRPYNREVKLETQFTFYNERKGLFEGSSKFLNEQLAYLNKNKQAYIFCHPDFEDAFHEILSNPTNLDKFYSCLRSCCED